jgi:hypothetical protein
MKDIKGKGTKKEKERRREIKGKSGRKKET